ncbi:hypothetical protein GPALN_014570 [Globodera pallida]|nr:hypothetical protein GPALN_014570 [Globodera pallida]
MNSLTADDADFDFVTENGEVDTLAAERGKGHNIGEEKGVDDGEAETKSDKLEQKNAVALQQADAVALERPFDAHKVLQQTLLKLEEYQNEQRQNQKEICVQIGELKKLVGPGAGTFCLATELITQAAVRANVVASGEEHRKLLTELEALRAQMAEVKGLHKMQEQREAQILLRMDKLRGAFNSMFLVLTPQNRWDFGACAKVFTLVEPKRLIAKCCGDKHSDDFLPGGRSVFAEMPIPNKDRGIFYFELEVGAKQREDDRANAGEQLCRISQTLLRLRTAAIKAERAAKSQLKSGPDGTPVQPTAKDQRTGLATATEAAVQECKRTLADVLAPPGRRHQGERAAKALRTNAAPPAPIASDAKNKEQNIAPPTQLQHQPHQQRPELEISIIADDWPSASSVRILRRTPQWQQFINAQLVQGDGGTRTGVAVVFDALQLKQLTTSLANFHAATEEHIRLFTNDVKRMLSENATLRDNHQMLADRQANQGRAMANLAADFAGVIQTLSATTAAVQQLMDSTNSTRRQEVQQTRAQAPGNLAHDTSHRGPGLAMSGVGDEQIVGSRGWQCRGCILFFGLAPRQMPVNNCVGYHKGSYAYDNWGTFWGHPVEISEYGVSDTPSVVGMPEFDLGDVVGCGVNLATRQIIYTLNGERLDTANLFVDSATDLFPCLSSFTSVDKIEANFGPNFKFNIFNGI